MKKTPDKSNVRTNPLDLLSLPLGGGLPIPGFTGGSATSGTGPQSSSDIVSIPYNAPFIQGDGNTADGVNSDPSASGSATSRPATASNDVVLIAAVVVAGIVMLARR